MSTTNLINTTGLNSQTKKIDNDSGFTLVELMIAIGVFAIISIALMVVFDSFQRGYTTQQVTLDVVQKARSAISFMAYDIKQAGLDPRETDDFRVRKATATEFTFDFDTPDSAGVFDGTLDITNANRPERRTYLLSGTKLYQINNAADPSNVPVPAATSTDLVLLTDIITTSGQSRFEYIDKDRNTMTVPVAATNFRNIRGVRVFLTVSERSGRDGNISRTMDTMVLCRNLLFNDNRSKNN